MSLGKMSSLTITDIKFLCKCYLPLNLYSRTFQACIKEEEEKKNSQNLGTAFVLISWLTYS